FADVVQDSYYEKAVGWAAKNEIVGGYGEGFFGPDDNVTREQFATILYRYAKFKGIDVSVGEDTNILSFGDAMDVSEYAVAAMQWACGDGVITGKPGGLLDPKGSATRAEAAAMLHRFIEK
ncbi:S-layer homology domain-containing protein, partial [Oscillospiraceae bacterium OttesenSCG-928-G22]|nr:S-layer homology domain-containing protein [Oscillospiraceae bacterium OttesenSCG-928-G22]